MLIVDAHLDLAMNAIEWNRDLTRPIEEIRAREAELTDKPDRGKGTVSFSEMRRGGVGLCVATQIARYVAPDSTLYGWNSPEQAWAMTQAQLAWYRAMEERGELVQIRDRAGLDRQVGVWENVSNQPSLTTQAKVVAPKPRSGEGGREPRTAIGYILSLEGADSILTPAHLERAYAQGLRAVGPAHYGPGRYAYGTNSTGDLGTTGRELLREMERLGIILDVTHLCDESLRDALDHFNGPIWASHSNSRALVAHNRQFSDDQIRELIGRGAVIGAVVRRVDAGPGMGAWRNDTGISGRDARHRRQSHRSRLSARRKFTTLDDRIRSRRRIRTRAMSIGRPHDRGPRETRRRARRARLLTARRREHFFGKFPKIFAIQLVELNPNLNHPVFGNPSTSVTSGTFGQITGISGSGSYLERQIQMGLRFSF